MSFSAPSLVIARLEDIEADLAERQNELEEAALVWYRLKRDLVKVEAEAFLGATGAVAVRRARAVIAVAEWLAEQDSEVIEAEGRYEALKAVVRVLDTRASIGQSLLKAQGRA